MCGIAGFVSQDASSGASAILRRMTEAIAHRGPDDSGYYLGAPAFLGHRRLSIVDLSGGHQPMANEDGSRVIVFNGEIFNHAGTRPVLERAGHRYASRSDTETILHGWEEWGPGCLERFRGMFAFAIWDEKSRRLVAARDRLGIKPFYYFWDGRTFAFASEIKALLRHPCIEAAPAEDRIAEYLAFGYVSGEQTLFRGIRKLPPGHWLEWFEDSGGKPQIRIAPYWDVPMETAPERSESEWIAETRRRLEETVQLRLMADVPLGTFLSGGVDSSAITALVKRMTPGRVDSFSVGYKEARYSELPYARQVAECLDTNHREIVLGREEFFDALPAMIWQEDEPVAWPSSVSLYFVSLLASRHVKVVLTGEGADEIFGGYERYRWNRWNLRAAAAYRYVPGPVRHGIRGALAALPLLRADLRRKIGHTFLSRDLSVESLYLDNFYAAFPAGEQATLLKRPPEGVYDEYLRHWEARPDGTPLGRMLYADIKTYLVELLMKQDQMSMAASIESRVPFLDHHFVAFAMSMPDHMKIRGHEQKYVLKKAVSGLLPDDIIYRKKMGFPTPLRQWFRDPSSDGLLRTLTAPDAFLSRWVHREEVAALIGKHRTGFHDATDRLWRLLNLELWGGMFFGSGGAAAGAQEAARRLERIAV
jgi:asparagine synthase (glutamine-hydrolysing)